MTSIHRYSARLGALALLFGLLTDRSSLAVELVAQPSYRSSYECRTVQVSGMPSAGKGSHGCHFRLHDPETERALPHTPYQLDVYPPRVPGRGDEGGPVASLTGVTDAEGRSGYVRAPFPIVPNQVRFVRRVGNGTFGRSPQLVRPTDGEGVAGFDFEIKGCGVEIRGVTDEQGYSVLVESETSCALDVDFAQRQTPMTAGPPPREPSAAKGPVQ